jgi:hypothetical protein
VGAQVIADGRALGTTPLHLVLASGESRKLTLVQAGYRDSSRTVRAGDGTVSVELQKLPAAAPAKVARPAAAPAAEGDDYRKVDDLKDPFANDPAHP